MGGSRPRVLAPRKAALASVALLGSLLIASRLALMTTEASVAVSVLPAIVSPPQAPKPAEAVAASQARKGALDAQQAHCIAVTDSQGHVAKPPTNSELVELRVRGVTQPVQMYTISTSDIVSSALKGQGFETGITATILRLLSESNTSSPLFVDIGANVGLHAVPVAASGFDVIAIEGAPTNQALLRTTWCNNQPLLRGLIIVGTALGQHAQNCSMWAPAINTGNGMMYCAEQPTSKEMVRLGDATVMRLDDILDAPAEVMKMDVEGFEAHVLAGASRLFITGAVQWLFMEYSPGAVVEKGGDPLHLLVNLVAYGFQCTQQIDGSTHPSSWQYLGAVDLFKLADKAKSGYQTDLFCRRRSKPLNFLSS